MKVDFSKMSDDQILEYVENLTDEEFEALDEDAVAFLEKYLDEEEVSESVEEEEDTGEEEEVSEEEVSEGDEIVEEEEDTGEEEEVSEETKSAATLHPGKGSGGTDSKFHTLETFVKLLQQLGKEDLTHLYKRTVDQIGHEADKVPGSAEKNRSTINAKPSAAKGKGGALAPMPMPKLSKEDIDEIFGNDVLTEESKEKASTIFEAALNTRIILETERLEEAYGEKIKELEESYETKLTEEVEALTEEVISKTDQYLNYCVECWMEDNNLAIENSLRADISESFIEGLQELFTKHYIKVPEEKLDIVNDMKEELDSVTEKLCEAQDRVIELENLVVEATKEALFDEVTEGMTKTEVEKLRSLTEAVEYEDDESYQKKLNIIKENYFDKKKSPTKGNKTGLITEEIAGEVEGETEKAVSPEMAPYIKAISKIKK